ncbi:hypothetical protein FRC02_011863 [Tulasnella sp. 418]|nr:hypothetical protein FRC02_011863 [Tulasnella sp. 418]
MSLSSISSTYPEPATSPSPRAFHYPNGFVHGPLRRTYAFYIPRKISRPTIRPIQSISQARTSGTRRSKLNQPTRSSLGIRNRSRVEGDEEAPNEPEETMAPPAKRRKIKG